MQWFDTWFRKQCKKAWDYEYAPNPTPNIKGAYPSNKLSKYKDVVNTGEILENINGITIRMFSATGGSIIQVSHFNVSSNNYIYDTYVIPDELDLGTQLNTILVQHKLKHG